MGVKIDNRQVEGSGFMKRINKPSVVEGNVSELAREVGVDRSHVSLILNGKRMPSFPVAGKLAKAMGISLDELHERLVPAA